ncbi:MAG: hypothetical protein JSW07_21265 [bacterium]|nr:MAG: hypothetical protein JSW07_21265 [bacterium]
MTLIQDKRLASEEVTADSSTGTVRELFAPIVQTIKETSLKSPVKLDNALVIQFCIELISQAKDN